MEPSRDRRSREIPAIRNGGGARDKEASLICGSDSMSVKQVHVRRDAVSTPRDYCALWRNATEIASTFFTRLSATISSIRTSTPATSLLHEIFGWDPISDRTPQPKRSGVLNEPNWKPSSEIQTSSMQITSLRRAA